MGWADPATYCFDSHLTCCDGSIMALLNWDRSELNPLLSNITTRNNLGCKVKQARTKKGKPYTGDISKSTLWRLSSGSAKPAMLPCLGKGELTVVTNGITSGQGDSSSDHYLHAQNYTK
jgi:hypothetical protein